MASSILTLPEVIRRRGSMPHCYTLLNPSSPRIATQMPLAGTITGLTSLTLTFTEPVSG
jgi:hypothetical protein